VRGAWRLRLDEEPLGAIGVDPAVWIRVALGPWEIVTVGSELDR
jgi:hypothetical protein